MKVFLFFLFFALSSSLFAQKVEEAQLPKAVVDGFLLAYPDAGERSWEIRGKRFLAFVKYADRTEVATFVEDGEWLETRYAIDKAEIPDSIPPFIESRYAAYRVVSMDYVEENGGGNYYAVLLALKSNKELSTELIFDIGGVLQMIDGLPVVGNMEGGFLVKEESASKLQPGIQKEIEADPLAEIPEAIIVALVKRYAQPEKIEWGKSETGYRTAKFTFRDVEMATEWDEDGSQVSVISYFDKKNMPFQIEKFIAENHPKAKLLLGERYVYETRYSRRYPEKGLKNYFKIRLSERIDRKQSRTLDVYFDHTGQLDIIVEVEDENSEEKKDS